MKYFVFISIIFFLISCEVEESKNVYLEPEVPPFFDYALKNRQYPIDSIDDLKQNLSILLDAEVKNLREIKINFDNAEIADYIDCGRMNDEIYVDYIDRIFDSYLEVIINFNLIQNKNNFIIDNKDIRYTFFSKETGTRWKFKTNQPKVLLVGNPVYDDNPYRTCLSKNILESRILNIINNL
tara:strand:+ start:1220 stop:1765 length:546 start_codon:yes stop_codon:yes gene_type:complete